MLNRKTLEIGGIIAAFVLIAFGAVAIYMGVDGRQTVRDSLAAEKIVGGDDMSPIAIQKGIKEAGLTGVTVPTMDIVGEPIDTGAEARAFAGYIRIHTLEASEGLTYAEMGRFMTADGNPAGTSDETKALKDESGKPVPNGTRNTWVTATALTTALNTSYMAEQIALFGIVVGFALLLTGVGFAVLVLTGAVRQAKARAAVAAPAIVTS